MISEAFIETWSHKRSQLWLLVGLAFLGSITYVEQGWKAAIRAPLGIVTVVVVAAVAADLLLWIFRRESLGKSWRIMLAAAVVLVSSIAIVGEALWISILAVMISGVILVVGYLKSLLYR